MAAGRDPLRPAYRLARHAAGGEQITLYVEMACNRLFGVDKRARYALEQAEIAVFDCEAWDLLWDFKVIADLAQELPDDTPARRAGAAGRQPHGQRHPPRRLQHLAGSPPHRARVPLGAQWRWPA